MLIDIICGARPNFIKISPIIAALKVRAEAGGVLQYRLVHTGQHYDSRMSGNIFTQLGIPDPDVNLEVGSGTQAEQTGEIMIRYEKLIKESPPKLCLVVGDVTSTMACAIAAKKLGILVAHVEAGIRSGDLAMPEEINRIVTDSITDVFFTTSTTANANLRSIGTDDNQIFFVGNTMIDTLLHHLPLLRKPEIFDKLALVKNEYFVTTLHRPGNVDCSDRFSKFLVAIGEGTVGIPVIFPTHPRTSKALKNLDSLPENIHFIEPQAYLEFIWLVKHAKAVITDSGGITEEATVLRIPCLTLRDSTERPETVEIGTNELIGINPDNLAPALDRVLSGKWKTGKTPERWDGKSAERIVTTLEQLLR